MRAEIRYLTTAVNDLKDIFFYIKADKPQAASQLLDKIDRGISNLADFPSLSY